VPYLIEIKLVVLVIIRNIHVDPIKGAELAVVFEPVQGENIGPVTDRTGKIVDLFPGGPNDLKVKFRHEFPFSPSALLFPDTVTNLLEAENLSVLRS